MKYKLVLTYSDSTVGVFKRFLESLSAQGLSYEYLFVCIYQGSQPLCEHDFMINSYIKGEYVLLQSERCSLSKARNIGLEYIYKHCSVSCEDLILFPDDDCWLEKDFFRNVSSLDWDRNDFYSVRVFDPYVNKAFGKRRKNVKIALNYLNSFKLPISVGLIIKLSVFVDKVKFFNESLGVGTAIGSGEETEVVLKLLKHKCSGEYNGYINVYHEVYQVDNAFISKTEKYAVGQGYCLRQFSKQFSSILWLVFIELLIRSFGGYLLLSGNKSKMYKSRFKSLLKGAFGRYIL